MLEIHGAPDSLAEASEEAAPSPCAQRLIPRLKMVDPARQEHRKGAGDNQVVECAARMVDDPVPFLVVDHLPPTVRQHARGARVQDEEARVSEVTVEGPAARGRLTIPRVGEPAKERSRLPLTFHLQERRVLLELGRGEVAEMLVEPI